MLCYRPSSGGGGVCPAQFGERGRWAEKVGNHCSKVMEDSQKWYYLSWLPDAKSINMFMFMYNYLVGGLRADLESLFSFVACTLDFLPSKCGRLC